MATKRKSPAKRAASEIKDLKLDQIVSAKFGLADQKTVDVTKMVANLNRRAHKISPKLFEGKDPIPHTPKELILEMKDHVNPVILKEGTLIRRAEVKQAKAA